MNHHKAITSRLNSLAGIDKPKNKNNMKSPKNLTPAIVNKIVEDTNDMYYHRHKLLNTGTTRENWEKCHKECIERAGYNYNQFQQWCFENMPHDKDEYFYET